LLATGSPDNSAILWDLTKGTILHTFLGCSGLANCVTFNADDRLLITGANDGSVRFYETQTGRLAHNLPERSGSVSWLTVGPDQKILATINHGSAVQLWDISQGRQLHELKPFSSGVTSLRFSPDGTVLAANDYQDRSVKLWNVRDGKLMHVIAGNLTCSAFNPDGTTLVTGDETGSLRFWGRMVMTREAYELQVERSRTQATAKSPRKAGWITEATGIPEQRFQTGVETERQVKPERGFGPRAASRAETLKTSRADHISSQNGATRPQGEPTRRGNETERPATPAPQDSAPRPMEESRHAEPGAARASHGDTNLEATSQERVKFPTPSPARPPYESQAARARTARLRQTPPAQEPPFRDTEARAVYGRAHMRKTTHHGTAERFRSITDYDTAASKRSTTTRRKHPKGTCLVCGEPLSLWAKMCGIKLCKEHYF
jgi:hypothetical protein